MQHVEIIVQFNMLKKNQQKGETESNLSLGERKESFEKNSAERIEYIARIVAFLGPFLSFDTNFSRATSFFHFKLII